MDSIKSVFTVFFEDPFWVGIFERTQGKKYEAAKVVFGAEPANAEIYEFLLNNWHRLRFSPVIDCEKSDEKKINPKRMQREINKQVSSPYSGTKSQQAMKLLQEQNKLEHKERSREEREAEKERQFSLRQEKKLKRHKGH
ncbi:MAG: YjdF family protein [Oscillospiraceae bacterium]|nr:YjdF family protein [Oscillospiraceae bacterium]